MMGEMADYVNELAENAQMDEEAEFQRITGELHSSDLGMDILTESDEDPLTTRRDTHEKANGETAEQTDKPKTRK